MDRNQILKNFAIGFIPLFVFIAADELYGTETGLLVAIVAGLSYLVYYFLRHHRLEKMILFDTGLIVILGGISIVLHDDIFFKLKPALIELILLGLVGVHAFSSRPLLLDMSRRYVGDIQLPEEQLVQMKRLSRLLFVVVLLHVVLIVYSAYFMSKEAWAFISGGLFYILFGLILAGQWVYVKFVGPKKVALQNPPLTAEEMLDIVDESGKKIGRAARSRVHGDPSLLHPTVHIHIFSRQGKIYLQKRAGTKDLYPGFWDTAVGGHVRAGESIEHALHREALEELGLKPDRLQPLYRYVMRNEYESELVHTFKMIYDGPFRNNREEVEMGRFWSVFEIKKMMGQGIFTPNFEQEMGLLEKMRII